MTNSTNTTVISMDVEDFVIIVIFFAYIIYITVIIALWELCNGMIKYVKKKLEEKKIELY